MRAKIRFSNLDTPGGSLMTDLQRLQLRQSEIRSQLAKIAAADATDETRAQVDELGTEYGHNESNLRALTIAGDEPVETKSEDREFAALVSGANLGELLLGVLEPPASRRRNVGAATGAWF